MRLFIGIDLPQIIKVQIEENLRPLQLTSKGWESAHDYHQTLLFIGQTEDEKIPGIIERMNQIIFPEFTLRTNGIAFFNRRIMYIDFLPSEELNQLKYQVDLKFPEYVRPDEKEFVPHVTVKRWQRYEYDFLTEGVLAHPLPFLQFDVIALALFKSERDENNLKYHVLHQTFLHKN